MLVLSATFAVVACGGSTPTPTDGADAAPTPTPTPVVGAPTPATTTPPEATTIATPVDPVDALPAFDLSALSGAIPGVDSYRTSFSVDGVVQYESVVVTQPVLSKAITTYDGDVVSSRFVVIGDDVWTADGADGRFEPIPAAFAGTMLLAFDPTVMLAGFAGADFANSGAANLGTEDKNGVRAVHVRLDSTSLLGAAGAMPAGSAIDIWVAEAGHLVAWEMSGFGADSDIAIQVTGVNDSANVVARPS